MLTKAELRLLKKRSQMVVVDLNAVKEGPRLDELKRKVARGDKKLLIEGLSIEELAKDPPTAAKSLSIFFTLLRPVRDNVLAKRETHFLMYEECATCTPVVDLISGQNTRVIRDIMAIHASTTESILEALPGLSDIAARSAAGDKTAPAQNIILGGMRALRANVDPQRIREGIEQRSKLAPTMAALMLKSSLHFANGFEKLPLERARDFLLHSFTARISPALFAVQAWYAGRDRQGSPDGAREENDMYDVFYAILGSITGGLESYDQKSAQPFVYDALNAGREWVEAMSIKLLAEDIAEIAGTLHENGDLEQGWHRMADVGEKLATEELRIAEVWR